MTTNNWTVDTPTVLVDAARDRITARSGKIEYDIEFTNLRTGLAPFVSQFGNLYHGKFTPEHFSTVFNTNRTVFLNNLINAQSLTDWEDYKLFSSAFYMYMCRVAQRESWIWPALCFRRSDSIIEQTSGISRIVATGICKKDPWNYYRALFLESKDRDPADTLADFVAVDTDKKLHEVLNLDFSTDFFQVSTAKIGLTFNPKGDLELNYINNHNFHDIVTPHTKKLWADLVAWHRRYGTRPRLKIYTDWPELVDNQEGFWDVEIAGPSEPIYRDIFYPGHIERAILNLHNEFCNNTPDKNIHVMNIIKPRYINVTELLCWLNLDYTTFIDSNSEFIVYRYDEKYANTTIDLSYIPRQ